MYVEAKCYLLGLVAIVQRWFVIVLLLFIGPKDGLRQYYLARVVLMVFEGAQLEATRRCLPLKS
jgi:hypothetical protein